MKSLKYILAGTTLAMMASTSAQAIDLSWSGFGSGFYGQALNKQLLPYGFSSTNADFTNFSLVGLTVNAKVTGHWSAAFQLVANGASFDSANYSNDYRVRAQWAYVNYAPDDKTSFRIGRQRYSIFTASEFIFQHYLLPFRSLPSVVYEAAPFNSFDGVSASREIDVGSAKINIQVFGGAPIVDFASTTLTIGARNLIGARVNVEGDGWKIRAQASRALEKITYAATGAPFALGNEGIYSVGYRYDKYNIVSWGEYLLRNSQDGSANFYGNSFRLIKAGYVLIGFHLEEFMPRYTFAQNSTHYGFEPTGMATTHTIGLNYSVSPTCVIKGEFEIATASPVGGGWSFTQPTGATDTSGNSIYAGVDFAF